MKHLEGARLKTIGLLGGTGWSSTIGYYKILNEMVNQRLGGNHSAKILLKSIDYHDISSNYGKDDKMVARLLHQELLGLISLNPDCIMICCNTLHKFYDLIKDRLPSEIPVMHAVDLVAQHIKQKGYQRVLLLATKFTLDDGFFAHTLENAGIEVTLPNADERETMKKIHEELMQNSVTDASRNFFENLILKHNNLDAVVLGCTEYPLVVDQATSALPVINPVHLQAKCAVEHALSET